MFVGRLRGHLHYVFKTCHSTEYCDRGSCGSSTTRVRLDGNDGLYRPKFFDIIFDYICLDSSPFWALAIARRSEYKKANIPMLPITHGVPYTLRQILLYTILLFGVSLLPYAVYMAGWNYLVGAIALNSYFLSISGCKVANSVF